MNYIRAFFCLVALMVCVVTGVELIKHSKGIRMHDVAAMVLLLILTILLFYAVALND